MPSYLPGHGPKENYTHTLHEVAVQLGNLSHRAVKRIIRSVPNRDFYSFEKTNGVRLHNFKEFLAVLQESQKGINTPACGVTVKPAQNKEGINGRDGRPNNLSTPTVKPIRLRSERRKSVSKTKQ